MLQCALFLAVIIQSVMGSCNLGWLEYEDSCYSVNTDPLNWFGAAATCNVYGGHLAQIESEEEHEWLAAILKDKYVSGAWLGGTSRLHENVWEWVPSFRRIGADQTESGYVDSAWNTISNWLPGSSPPTNFLKWDYPELYEMGLWGSEYLPIGNGYCMEMSKKLQYQWIYANCHEQKAFVCEKDL